MSIIRELATTPCSSTGYFWLLLLVALMHLAQTGDTGQKQREHISSELDAQVGPTRTNELADYRRSQITGGITDAGSVKMVLHDKKQRHDDEKHGAVDVINKPASASLVQEQSLEEASRKRTGKHRRASKARAAAKEALPAGTHRRKSRSVKDTSKKLLNQIESLIQNKGRVGLNDEEKAFIEEIQTLWKEDIMPAIQSAVSEGRDEINSLFAAILECEQHLGEDSDRHVDLIRNIDETKENLEECAHKESGLVVKKDKECREVLDMKSDFIVPPTPPGPDATNAERLQFLKDMDTYFCGTNAEFKEKMDECDDVTDNHTDVAKTCTSLQGRLESYFCVWKNGVSGICQTYDSCRTGAIQRYLEAKDTVKDEVEQEHKEYIAAVRIECLWDAWNLSDAPCLVDEEKVEECYNKPVNLSNLTILFPMVPDPHKCSMDAEGQILTHGPEDHPCTDEFIGLHYRSMGLNEQVIKKMEDVCKHCTVVVDEPLF